MFDNKCLLLCNRKSKTELHDEDLKIERTAKSSNLKIERTAKFSTTIDTVEEIAKYLESSISIYHERLARKKFGSHGVPVT